MMMDNTIEVTIMTIKLLTSIKDLRKRLATSVITIGTIDMMTTIIQEKRVPIINIRAKKEIIIERKMLITITEVLKSERIW
jgi:hypothetical protein